MTSATSPTGATSPTTPGADASYESFARRILAGGILSDPWYDGAPRFSSEPVRVSRAQWGELARCGEAIAEAYDEVRQVIEDDPALLDGFFGLTPCQKLMWEASRPLWHGIARADVFLTAQGPVIAELNSDTPTGEAEAVELGRLAGAPELDPNRSLGAKLVAMVELFAERLVSGPASRTVGLVYPTELSEDLSLVRLYRRWLEEAGWSVVLGSPYNLDLDASRRATLFGQPIAVMIRHYKTDWWGERSPAWIDDDIPDELPLSRPLEIALESSVSRRTVAINPFGAVVMQNKRSMALMWEHIHRFSERAQATIEKLLPYTVRLEAIHPEQVRVQREDWVIKSDYGAEGDEVVIGRLVSQAEWERSLALARPGRWIAQRYFEAIGGANYGVFLVGGEAAGLYLRVQEGVTDPRARSVPVHVV